jgi:hypothetical protein
MEPEGSLPCSQDPATGPYPDPYVSSPHFPTHSKQDCACCPVACRCFKNAFFAFFANFIDLGVHFLQIENYRYRADNLTYTLQGDRLFSLVFRWIGSGIAQRYSPGRWTWQSGFESRQGMGIFLFTTVSRPALGPTQPHIQWLPGALSLGVKRLGREADHSPPSRAEVINAWRYTSTR